MPWVYLVVHLFFIEGEADLLRWFKDHDEKNQWTDNQALVAVIGVVLFAMAFTLGSAVSRIAQDFFNDDDLRIPWLFRMTATEDRIIASVYCQADENLVLLRDAPDPLNRKLADFDAQKKNCCSREEAHRPEKKDAAKQEETGQHKDLTAGEEPPAAAGLRSKTCQPPGAEPGAPAGGASLDAACLCNWLTRGTGRRGFENQHYEEESDFIKTARDMFGLEENALLLKGDDYTLRLRQLHDQIMVLRGATFDGFLALAFCLLGWGVVVQRKNYRSPGAIFLSLVPALFLFVAGVAYDYHLQERDGTPPYMEFSLFLIGCGGAWLLWVRPLLGRLRGGGKANDRQCLGWRWGTLSLVFAVLFVAGTLGWWATEVLYGQQVIYSYDTQGKTTK